LGYANLQIAKSIINKSNHSNQTTLKAQFNQLLLIAKK